MRGKVNHLLRGGHADGITPAHAGKSVTYSNFRFVNRDHPRACGEKPERRPRSRQGLGSPPRMRGKVVGTLDSQPYTGITPAHAGKSFRHHSAGI